MPDLNAPSVSYVTTQDGYSIAYTDCGTGEPFVFMPVFLGHLLNLWELGRSGSLLRDLAARFRLVSYDARGQGLSTRGLQEDVTLDDFFLDFETVRDHLGLKRFILFGSCNFALQAAHYAARHPDQVKALILINAALSWDAWRLSSVYEHLPAEDWEMFVQSLVTYNLRPEERSPELIQRLVQLWGGHMTQRDYLNGVPAWRTASLEDVASEIEVPTLVLHSTHFRIRAVEGPMELTRKLPNARLRLMDAYNLFGDPGQAIEAIDEFIASLGADQATHGSAAERVAAAGEGLPPRQLQVLRLIADGKTNGEIADELVISLRTVERHVAELYARLGVRNRVEAAAFAINYLARA